MFFIFYIIRVGYKFKLNNIDFDLFLYIKWKLVFFYNSIKFMIEINYFFVFFGYWGLVNYNRVFICRLDYFVGSSFFFEIKCKFMFICILF